MRGSDEYPGGESEAGSASIEFIAAGVVLLVPLMYLVLALSTIQQATLAVEGGSRHGVRVFVQSETQSSAFERLRIAIDFALADAHITQRASSVVTCHPIPSQCLAPGTRVTVETSIQVPLPFIPTIGGFEHIARVAVTATASQVVSRFHGSQP